MSRRSARGLSRQDPIDLTSTEGGGGVSHVKKRKLDLSAPTAQTSASSSSQQSSSTKKASRPVDDVSSSPAKKRKTESERGETRLRRFRKTPPQAWQQVYDRAMSQRFFVLQRERCGTEDCPEEKVEMAGSTGNIYTIHIAQVSSCNCPHALTGHECKHVIYVMSQVLRAPFELVYQRALTNPELRAVFAAAPPAQTLGHEASSSSGDQEKRKRKDIEGDCPICFSELEPDSPESITWCRAMCGQNMHQECVDVWLGQGKKTCPMCRSDWHVDAKAITRKMVDDAPRSEGYANVGHQLGLSMQRDESTYSEWSLRRRNRERFGRYRRW